MSYRALENVDGRILDAVVTLGAQGGISCVTSRKIAAHCGISHFTVHSHFGTMHNVICAAADRYNRKLLDCLFASIGQGEDLDRVADDVMDFMLSIPEETLCYFSCVFNFEYRAFAKDAMHSDEVMPYAHRLFRGKGAKAKLTDEEVLQLWDYFLLVLLHYAESFLQGALVHDDSSWAFAKQIMFSGLKSCVRR